MSVPPKPRRAAPTPDDPAPVEAAASPRKPTRAAPTLASPASGAVLQGEPGVLYPIGLRTVHGKFITVESFGDQLNGNGVALRSKQVFMLESDGTGKHAFKSHNGKYLAADHREVTATSTSKGSSQWFTIIYKNGICTLLNSSKKFISVDSAGSLGVRDLAEKDTEFEIVVNLHPQMCIMNGKRYWATEKEELVSNRDTQFGRSTLFTIEEGDNRGHYAIKGSGGKYLQVDAEGLVRVNGTDPNGESAQFLFEFHGSHLTIKSVVGKYLSVSGNGIKAARENVTTKEIFKIIDSDAQITLRAHNNKFVSFQGTNLISNRDTITNDEVFILENIGARNFALKTVKEHYWSVKNDVLAVDSPQRGQTEVFTLEYHGAHVALIAPNGKYLTAKPLGGIDAKSSEVNPQGLFEMFLLNRPQLVLKTCQSSYVGGQDGKIRSNKTQGETFTLEYNKGVYAIKTSQGKYLQEGEQGRIQSGDAAEWFFLEFMEVSQLAIKTQKGKYIKSENQGWLVASESQPGPSELFEF